MDREGFEWGIKGLVLTLFILSTVIVLAQSALVGRAGASRKSYEEEKEKEKDKERKESNCVLLCLYSLIGFDFKHKRELYQCQKIYC